MTQPQSPTARLEGLGLRLPEVPKPAGAYVPAVVQGGLVWTAGQVPFVDGSLPATGVVGEGEPDASWVGPLVDPAMAKDLARICALNALAAAAAAAGGLDALVRVVKVVGFVASAPGFGGQPGVVNGASELLGEVFPGTGGHARSAVGVAGLPLGAPVEIELVAALR